MKLTKLLTGAAMALGLATSAMAEDKTKVGFVYVGPVGDLPKPRDLLCVRGY